MSPHRHAVAPRTLPRLFHSQSRARSPADQTQNHDLRMAQPKYAPTIGLFPLAEQ